MSSRAIKKEIIQILSDKSWEKVQESIKKYPPQSVINHLFTALCSTDRHSKQHAINSFGLIIPEIAVSDIESARIIMRRFLWTLNDESGGIGWGSPESLAEIMVHSGRLFQEYVHMLVSYTQDDGPELLQDGNFLELPALQQGLLWGIARLSAKRQKEMRKLIHINDMHGYLGSSDKIVQGMSAFCLGILGGQESISQLEKVRGIDFSFNVYWDYTFQEKKMSSIVEKSIENIKKREEQ